MTDHSEDAIQLRAENRRLNDKYRNLLKRTLVIGAGAGLVILALNDVNKGQRKQIMSLSKSVADLKHDVEVTNNLCWDYYDALNIMAEVTRPTKEQYAELVARMPRGLSR